MNACMYVCRKVHAQAKGGGEGGDALASDS